MSSLLFPFPPTGSARCPSGGAAACDSSSCSPFTLPCDSGAHWHAFASVTQWHPRCTACTTVSHLSDSQTIFWAHTPCLVREARTVLVHTSAGAVQTINGVTFPAGGPPDFVEDPSCEICMMRRRCPPPPYPWVKSVLGL